MDPNATLARMRECVAIMKLHDESSGTYLDAAQELESLTEAMDDWLSGGGFLPDAWARMLKTGVKS